MSWKISVKAFVLLNEGVIRYTTEEGGEFTEVVEFPGKRVTVKDIVLCTKTLNIWNHVVWERPKALRGLDCHSFVTVRGKRYDAVNDFKVF